MNRVLVVGERPDEVTSLAFRLGLLGYETAPSASDTTLAMRALFTFKPDVIVFDAGRAEGARELFRLLERVSELPVLVMGDQGDGDELVWYLDEGAASYVSRPVSPTLLSARLATIMRRAARAPRGGIIRAGAITIDLGRHQVDNDGAAVSLTPTEFRLLRTLAEHAGRACSQKMLLEAVWGKDFLQCAHYLRLYMGYLRQKLEVNAKKPRLLLTEWGVGYRLVAEQMEARAEAAQAVRAAIA